MQHFSWVRWAGVFASAGSLLVTAAHAHGVIGQRFFPGTMATDDPFAADELALPTVSVFRHLDEGLPTSETEYEMEYSKTIFPGFAISFEGGYVHADAKGVPSASGFDNIELTPTLEVAKNEGHEFIASMAFSWEVGGTGSHRIGADSASSYTPKILFGKGFGDLPDSMALLRPLAVTGVAGYGIPGHGDEPHVFQWGGAIEYSLGYLQTNVRDVGLGSFVSHLTPLVEFSLQSPVDRDGGGTTGTVNPGLIWSGRYVQVGLEAIIPINRATGHNLGVAAQLHFYVDDIFPNSLGKPLFK